MRQLLGKRPPLTALLGAMCLLLATGRAAEAEQVSAVARIERDDLFLGESLVFQVQVQGDDEPTKPDLSSLGDFHVRELGGQTRNSESVTIINGDMNRVVHKGYVFSYLLTPKKAGRLIIPALSVMVDGQQLRTQPVTITVAEPAETEDFKLRLRLSKTRCYVGEPVTLTVTWYIGKDVRNFQFLLPLLEDKAFRFHDPETQIDKTKQYYRGTLGDGEVIAEKGRGNIDGKTYATLSFRKVLIPTQAGNYSIPRATVAFDALVGYRQSRDFFDDFFSDEFFGTSRRGVYKRFVVPSDSLELEVLDLPTEDRPANFAGHIGRYQIQATAAPLEANVGDPITLTITVSGPEFLRDVELPPLKDQPAFRRDFKIPEERASGKLDGATKIFTQTVRATHAGVTEIPSIGLPYFDTGAGCYSIARSKPIPLTIHSTRVITVGDVEGRGLETARSELASWSEGIAHNYEDMGVLENQQYGLATLIRSPLWMPVTVGPLAVYLTLLASTMALRHAHADPESRKARKAYSRLRGSLQRIASCAEGPDASGEVLEALREYLGRRLHRPAIAITYRDVEPLLQERGVSAETLAELRSIFKECEAGHYAGGGIASQQADTIATRAMAVVGKMEKALK